MCRNINRLLVCEQVVNKNAMTKSDERRKIKVNEIMINHVCESISLRECCSIRLSILQLQILYTETQHQITFDGYLQSDFPYKNQ
jgi:hypothetical protein